MRWSFKIVQIAGIDVRLHVTFLLLLLFFGILFYFVGGLPAAVGGLVFVCLLFLCVLLHEFGHAFAARAYGIPTPEITLLPIGGVARIARMPEKPSQELVIALAGPAVNVVIAAVLLAVIGWTIEPEQLEKMRQIMMEQQDPDEEVPPPQVGAGLLLAQLAIVNVLLVVFNMLPAFPMDGGRVLRAILASMIGYVKATEVAAAVGKVMAVLFGFVGLFYNPLLILIALFVWIGADQEATAARMRSLARDLYVRDAMLTRFECLEPEHTIEQAVRLLLAATQREFPIVDELGRPVGVLTRDDIIAALRERGPDTPVKEVMRRDVPTVSAGTHFEDVFQQMQESGCPALPVLDHAGRLVGMITPEHLGELMMVHTARREALPWRA